MSEFKPGDVVRFTGYDYEDHYAACMANHVTNRWVGLTWDQDEDGDVFLEDEDIVRVGYEFVFRIPDD